MADIIDQNKEDFYEEYSYLKPECEKSDWEKFKDGCKKVGDWCKENWKAIVITLVIVIGAILAIAAVIFTGGLALVPMLATGLTALGVSAATATTIATVISLSVAVIAVSSTLISSTMNIMDIWCDYSDNSTFQSWKKRIGWVALASNLFYSVGSIYNSFKGVSGKEFIANQKTISASDVKFNEAFKTLDKSGLKPGQTEISKSRVMEIYNNYDPLKAQSSIYKDVTGRYLVEGHHTTVANTMLGKGTGFNMGMSTTLPPSATNVYWNKSWYEIFKKVIKIKP